MAIQAQPRIELDYENVFSRLDQLSVYKYYIGDCGIGLSISSPLRKDNNPSFTLFVSESWKVGNKVLWKDFATGENGDLVSLIKLLFGLNYDQALHKIAEDFGLKEGTLKCERKPIQEVHIYTEKKHSNIQVAPMKFTKEGLDYWGQYYITEDHLKREHVYQVKELLLNKKRVAIAKDELVFGYHYPEVQGWKIYRPLTQDKKKKWLSNISLSHLDGINELQSCDKLLLQKSKKDKMVAQLFTSCVISTQNESTAALSKQSMELIKSKTNKLFIQYDSDEVGVSSCTELVNKFNEMGLDTTWVNVPKKFLKHTPRLKDLADICKYFGPEEVERFLKLKKLL